MRVPESRSLSMLIASWLSRREQTRRTTARWRRRASRWSTEVSALVECPDCGTVRVHAEAVTVRARIEADAWSYRFSCPSCHRRAVAATTRAAALQVLEAGAPVETWHWAGEMDERGNGESPFTLVDLLDLRVSLAEPDWIDELSRHSGDTDPR